LRALGPTLVLDTGDFCGTPDKAYGYNTELMLDIMKMIGYQAATVGEAEIARGLEFTKLAAARGGFDLVSANIYRVGQEHVRPFPPYVVKKVGGRRYGIIGVIGKEDKGANRLQFVFVDQEHLEREQIVISDPLIALKEMVPTVRKKCDVVIVLAHTGLERAKEIAKIIPGIDVVLVGHGGSSIEKPEKPGAIIAKCGQRSDRLGTVRLVTEGKQVIDFSGDVLSLYQDKMPFRPAVRTVVYDELNLDENGTRRTTAGQPSKVEPIVTSLAAQPPKPADTESRLEIKGDHFLGISGCKDCHVSQWAQWSTTTHSTAYQTLAEGDDWNNHACLPCHVTGYGELGGHSTTNLSPELWNVGCEDCHGMGTKHSTKALEVAEAACLKCHTKDQDPDFDFARDLVKVIH
jgi:hypothetical protein